MLPSDKKYMVIKIIWLEKKEFQCWFHKANVTFVTCINPTKTFSVSIESYDWCKNCFRGINTDHTGNVKLQMSILTKIHLPARPKQRILHFGNHVIFNRGYRIPRTNLQIL